ncbi:MAG: hypothetical protein AAFR77_09210 [Cyanobacteria bacterium J06631_2]
MTLGLIQTGQTKIILDAHLIESAAGLVSAEVDAVSNPESEDFALGLDITEESNFIFDEADGFTPVGGTIEHIGTITFNSALGDITVGNFSIGFDATRVSETTSGFFVANTFEGVLPDGAVLFDIGIPDALEIEADELNIGTADLLVANEFADVLLDTGLAADDLTGADVGDAAIAGIIDEATLIQDGTTSVALDTELLTAAAGLTLSGAEDTVDPASEDFAVGFDITEESDFVFSDEDGFAPLAGTIEHTGTITFDSAAGDITVGDFSIGFDAARVSETTSGFFVANTFEGVLPDGAVLFDVGVPDALEIEADELNIGTADLLVANEFADILLDTGLAADDLTGADVGDAAIAGIIDEVVEPDPEEETVTEDDSTDVPIEIEIIDPSFPIEVEVSDDSVTVIEPGQTLVQDGTTSVGLDVELLEDAAGLTLSGAEDTVDPASEDFAVGFDITEESDFIFSEDDGFAPVSGTIEHTGTVTFDSAAGDITVGDFSIGFDAARVSETTSGFFVANTFEGVLPDGAVLFDVGIPESVEIEDSELSLGTSDLLVAQEFADILQETGLAASDLTGADVGDAVINTLDI